MPESAIAPTGARRRLLTAMSVAALGAGACTTDPAHPPLQPEAPRAARAMDLEEQLTWYVARPSFEHDGGFDGIAFGRPGDRLVPGRYTGGQQDNVAVYRPADGMWYVRRADGTFYGVAWGLPTDSLVPADYDGDGRTNVAVWRPEGGEWWIHDGKTGGHSPMIAFGQPGDVPVPADYDGDGRADAAVFRPDDGTWYVLRSSLGFQAVTLGQHGDRPVPADYDGDGRTDVALFRPATGTWHLLRSTTGKPMIVSLGSAGDVPVPADYNGDGRTDVAVWQPGDGTWRVRGADGMIADVRFGQAGDAPRPGRYGGAHGAQYTAVRVTMSGVTPSSLVLQSGDSTTLQATTGGCLAAPRPVTCPPPVVILWTSDNPTLVAVGPIPGTTSQVTVHVVGTGPGTATITASLQNGQPVGQATVTVPR